MIKRIFDETEAFQCDELLTQLIQDERKYDESIDSNFVVQDYFKNVIKKSEHILLGYVDKDKVVGYIYLKPVEKGYLIDGLYVLENYRNRKIATKLIDESLNILNELKPDFIDIKVLNDNYVAKKIYKSFGFNEFKIHMRKNIR